MITMDTPTSPTTHRKACPCPHHHVIPAAVVIFALLFLLKALGVLSTSFVDVAWPIVVGVAGLSKLCEGACKCC